MLKDILTYLLLIAVLRGVVDSTKFMEYFEFFSGLILILLLVTPVLSYIGNSGEWFKKLEENLFQMDKAEMETCLESAKGSLQRGIQREYEKELENQVCTLMKNQGWNLEETEVEISLQTEGWEITKISGKLGYSEEEKTQKDGVVETISIPEIEKKSEKKEVNTVKGKKVKETLCRYFSIEKEKVYIWE